MRTVQLLLRAIIAVGAGLSTDTKSVKFESSAQYVIAEVC